MTTKLELIKQRLIAKIAEQSKSLSPEWVNELRVLMAEYLAELDKKYRIGRNA